MTAHNNCSAGSESAASVTFCLSAECGRALAGETMITTSIILALVALYLLVGGAANIAWKFGAISIVLLAARFLP